MGFTSTLLYHEIAARGSLFPIYRDILGQSFSKPFSTRFSERNAYPKNSFCACYITVTCYHHNLDSIGLHWDIPILLQGETSTREMVCEIAELQNSQAGGHFLPYRRLALQSLNTGEVRVCLIKKPTFGRRNDIHPEPSNQKATDLTRRPERHLMRLKECYSKWVKTT